MIIFQILSRSHNANDDFQWTLKDRGLREIQSDADTAIVAPHCQIAATIKATQHDETVTNGTISWQNSWLISAIDFRHRQWHRLINMSSR